MKKFTTGYNSQMRKDRYTPSMGTDGWLRSLSFADAQRLTGSGIIIYMIAEHFVCGKLCLVDFRY